MKEAAILQDRCIKGKVISQGLSVKNVVIRQGGQHAGSLCERSFHQTSV